MAGGNDTYDGALEVLAKQISTMMGLADANLPFCVSLLEQVTNERRSPELAMQRAGVLPGADQNAQGLGQLGLPGGGGMAAPSPSGMGAGVPGPGPMTAPSPIHPQQMQALLAG